MLSNISEGLSCEGYDPKQYEDRGERLEVLLTTVCQTLGEVGSITENKADVEFILGVVGSYLITKKKNKLPEDSRPPSYIFNTSLFPILDNSDEIKTEDIEDGE